MTPPPPQVGLFDYPPSIGKITDNVTSVAHREVAFEIAAESIVLLKNDKNILPLSKDKLKKIAVIGSAGIAPITHGGGSGSVTPARAPSPLFSIQRFLQVPLRGSNCSSGNFELGYSYEMNDGSTQSDSSSMVSECCNKCAAREDCLYFSFHPTTKRCFFAVITYSL